MKRFAPAAIRTAAFLACALLAPLATLGGASSAPSRDRGTLHDSVVIARVDDRLIRVYDFRDRYFSSDAETRPAPDSVGRVEFLKTMVDKEVMGLTALA